VGRSRSRGRYVDNHGRGVDTPSMEGAVGHRDRGAIAAASLTLLNAALLVTVIVLSYEPQRDAFGRATGLVTTCESGIGHGNADRWSPILLLIVSFTVAISIYLSLKPAISERLRLISFVVSGALLLISLALVVVPFGGTCIE